MGKTKPEVKHYFAGIPARAAVDPRLKTLHLKALAVIALHDRLGRNGFWAGNRRLAEMAGCNYARLSTTISELAAWGYIERRSQPMDRRKAVRSIIYDDPADLAVMARGRR